MKKLGIIFLIHALLYSNISFALGTRTMGVSARAESMGSAFTAVSDEASAVFYNPAGLTQIDDTGVNFNLSPIYPDLTYKNAYTHNNAESKQKAFSMSTFYAKRINQKIVFGIGIYAPFARKVNYPQADALFGFPIKSNIIDFDITPVLAVNLTDQFSFGLGPTLNYDYLSATVFGLKQKAHGYAISGVLSALYKINNCWKIGATYHLASSHSIDGLGSTKGSPFLPPNFVEPFRTKFKNPAYLSVGTAFQATPDLLLALDYELLFWGQIKKYEIIYDNPIFNNTIVINPKNSSNIHVGGEYTYKDQHKFRLGYVYAQRSFAKPAVTPITIDFNGGAYSAGYSYLHCNWRFDLGYELATTTDTINNSPIYNTFQGKYHANVSTLLFGINYQF